MATTTNQQLFYPATTAVVDVPADIRTAMESAETKLVQRFASAADRTTRRPTPTTGELCFMLDSLRFEYFSGGTWSPVGHSMFVDRADPGTTGSTPSGGTSTVASLTHTVPSGLPTTARYKVECDCFVSTLTGIGSSIGMTGASLNAPARVVNQSATYDGHLVGYDVNPPAGSRTYTMTVTSVTAGQVASWRFGSIRVELML